MALGWRGVVRWEEGHAEMGVEKNATCSKLCLLQVEFAWSGKKMLIFPSGRGGGVSMNLGIFLFFVSRS